MDERLKQRWVKALRSGRYKQASDALHYKDGACCCLGVLCRISGVKRELDGSGEGFNYDNNYYGLSDNLRKKFGVTKRQQNNLVALNDVREKNFKEIADYIEEKM